MKFILLAGGIGSGKSAVAKMLAARGVAITDVDVLNRELQRKGQPLFDRIVARWGPDVVGADGELERAALSRVVFNDKAQLAELTAMVAPVTGQEVVRRASLHLGTDGVAVVEAAMFLGRMYGAEGLLLIDVDPEVALARLVAQRGLSEAEARARISSQLPRDVRRAHADFVLDNCGDLAALGKEVDRAWAWITTTPDATPRYEEPRAPKA